MATNLTGTTFASIYKDDFSDSANYHRILFNAGRALQARELNQMQSIIQKEIEHFGSNVFVEGGVVVPGGITCNNRLEFIKLATGQLPSDYLTTVVGQTFTVQAPDAALQVKVIRVVPATGSDPDTLYVEYISTTAGTSGASTIRVGASQILSDGSVSMTTASSDVSGRGTEINVGSGVYFVQGHFVFTEKQSLIISKYTSNPTLQVGFKISEQVITATDNSALYDNQGATPNVASPGADRYRITLTLSKKSDILAAENFVYLCKVTSGGISDEVRVDNSYNEINNVLALRTKEESGNYIVKPFNANFDTYDSANLLLKVTDGIVYVDGYRLEVGASEIVVPKAQDTISLDNEIVIASFGNFIKGDIDDNKGLPNINTFEKLNLRSAVNHGGSTIGTARVRHVEEDNGTSYKFYLFDIRMNTGQSFSLTRSIGTSGSNYFNVTLEGGAAILKNTSNNSLLFPLPNTKPTQTGVTIDAVTVQKRVTFSTNVSGVATAVAIPSGYASFANTNQWIFSEVDSSVDTSIAVDASAGTSFDVSGGRASANYEVLTFATKSSPSARAKTLTNTTITKTWPADAESDGAGTQFISLDEADIFEFTSIKTNDSNGSDISTNFYKDNGQRDNYYGIGRLIIKPGVTISAGTNIFARFKYFEHNTNGDFFDITSYSAASVSYDKIPSHTLNDGTTVSLRDVIDFRPKAVKSSNAGVANINFDSDGALIGSDPIINALPANTGTFSADVVYYMPRSDRLIAYGYTTPGQKFPPAGAAKVITGVSSINPILPTIPEGSISLYDIHLNAFTLNDSDLTTTLIPAKRFTMADIADLENRVNNLQELTALSLLEANTSTLTVIDSAGLERTKAGFLADGFKDYAFSATGNPEYRASIDEINNVLSPIAFPRNTRIFFDSDNSTTIRKGDLVLLSIDSNESHLNQNLATEVENINPFAVITNLGHIELSPASDEWIETVYAPDNIITGNNESNRINPSPDIATIWPWSESDLINNWTGNTNLGVVTTGGSRFRRELIGDRVVDVRLIPFMRSRIIFFKANGLRANTKHFMFLGTSNISDYAREESTFERFSTRSENVGGNVFSSNTSHPNGSTDLIADSNGEIVGSFLIPGSPSLQFRTGRHDVTLTDVSNVNNDALSKAVTIFTSTGVLVTRQRDISSTRIPPPPPPPPPVGGDRDGMDDPLAQSFFVSQAENPNGIFLTKVDVFFNSKEADGGPPVQLQVRELINGTPAGSALPGAVKFLNASQVNIPSNLTDISTVRATPTTFEFEEPVYLTPQRSYAIVLLANSVAYKVYVAKTYDFVIGSTEQRVTKQPTLGSLFLSQNSITWTPDQARDLMFNLYRAKFSSSGVADFDNLDTELQLLPSNPILTDSGSTTLRVYHQGHGFIKNDYVSIRGLDSATSYAGILGSSIMGSRQIANVDWTGYTITADSSATGSLSVGGNGVIASQNAMYDAFIPQVQTLVIDDTSISASIKKTTGSSFANGRNTGTSGAYSKDASYSTITLNDINFNSAPKVIATKTNQNLSSLSGNKSLDLRINLTTTDTKVSPIVDMQRGSISTFENIIDNQDSSSTTLANVPLSIVLETSSTGGTSAAKHVTKPVTLEEPAVGLKIVFAANRPSVSNFEVYYKTATSDENLNDIGYIQVSETSNNPADENTAVFRQYEYLAGGQGGNLNSFTQFQVKIVMTSSNTSKPPKIKDLRTIALVT